jgi:FKBP-type peptidyl-prolyl cis-trans isomerase
MAAIDISGDGGVTKEVLVVGAGAQIEAGQTVFVHYTGRLADGTIFDSSVGKPHRVDGFYFTVGGGEVIAGWDIGFGSMKVGEKAVLTCKSDYAYGPSVRLALSLSSPHALCALITPVELRFRGGTVFHPPRH